LPTSTSPSSPRPTIQTSPPNPLLPCPISGQSIAEEWANTLTHGFGLIASIVGFILLTLYTSLYANSYLLVGSLIYGTSLVLMYLSSTWYHSCRCAIKKKKLRILDHTSIYLLIAGSYTPFALGPLKGPWGWTLLGVVWTMAAVGISLKVLKIRLPPLIDTGIYLGMGWLVVIAIQPISAALSSQAISWLAAGGAAYTLGVGFYLWKGCPFGHTIWHLFVLLGSACHYLCVLLYLVIPPSS
jgi:hemolysin III